MTYSITKPDAGPSPAVDVDQIRMNFQEWETDFGTNHIGMNDFNQGDHGTVIFQRQTAGSPQFTGGKTELFSKDATTAAGTEPQLFIKVPKFLPTINDPTQSPQPSAMQITNSVVNIAGPQYQTFIPGNYYLYTGTTNNVAVSIVLSPTPSSIVMAIATGNDIPGGNPWNIAVNVTQPGTIKINSNATGVYTFRWWAIAKA